MDVTSQDAAPFFETKTGSDKNFNPPLPETNLLPEECERPRTSRQHVCIRSRVKALRKVEGESEKGQNSVSEVPCDCVACCALFAFALYVSTLR